MDRETYERQRAFAGPKKPSMLRRCVGHDYHARQIYMITMVTEGRRPLLGKVVGRSDGEPGSENEPKVALSELGKRVSDHWWEIEVRNPEIEVIDLQMMPDHFHGILFVKERMEKTLGKVLLGFKQGCNKAYRELVQKGVFGVESVAVVQQQAGRLGRADDRSHGLLFARGYNDCLLLRRGQLDNWRNYLADNPRRLLLKREHPDFFHVQRNLHVGAYTFSAIGNRFLLDYPDKLQVQCSRRLSEVEIRQRMEEFIHVAQRGAVLVSPAISLGEKMVMRTAFERGFPLIYLQENGFTDLAKPGGKRMDACARGQLLILAPWEHHNEQTTIRRDQCLLLNEMAEIVCNHPINVIQ